MSRKSSRIVRRIISTSFSIVAGKAYHNPHNHRNDNLLASMRQRFPEHGLADHLSMSFPADSFCLVPWRQVVCRGRVRIVAVFAFDRRPLAALAGVRPLGTDASEDALDSGRDARCSSHCRSISLCRCRSFLSFVPSASLRNCASYCL